MTRTYLAAWTAPGSEFPPYLNVTRYGDEVVVIVRTEPKQINTEFICGFAADKGHPGRCTPGDDRCNNYCNMAPQKGAMADAPLKCDYKQCGETVSMRMPLEAFRALVVEIGSEVL